MLPSLTPARLLRLCLKELRESLRDRRTIVTLILMPLLVYPLLSLVLNRVLLTNITTKAESTVTLGISKELDDTQLPILLRVGYLLIQDREAAPTFIEGEVEDGKVRTLDQSTSLLQPSLLPLNDGGKAALRNGSADIVIVRRSGSLQSDESQAGRLLPQKQGIAALGRYQTVEGMEDLSFDVEGMRDLVGHLDVQYRKGDAASERALQMLERILAAVNNEVSRQVIGPRFEAPYRLYATPVVMKGNYADLLATMVPLVLVLMTMAGAVYPAIDLTAGERERGTMEALIVSPTPNFALLMAKYSAVVTVALLTALANLAAMTTTLWVSGIGKLIFGEGVLSAGVIGTVLLLLVLFTMFFAALLLAVTSFAKSFKEAQAYLIPLMLLALTPGVMSLLPGIKFTSLLATVPLVNIVLLAREVLNGNAEWNTAMVAIICNGIYAMAALSVASRLFGIDASTPGSQGSWRDLFSRPAEGAVLPSVDQMAITMAVMFPVYFILSSSLPSMGSGLESRLWISAGVSFLLLLGMPLLVCMLRRIRIRDTFLLSRWPAGNWLILFPSVLLIGFTAWMFAHEIFIMAADLGLATIGEKQFDEVAAFRSRLQELPLPLVLFAFAITPAVCEEFLFRGFVLGSLNRYSAAWAIVVSSIMFGLMHVLTSNVLAVERFLPTTFMGLLLGFLAVRTQSIWPGMLLHSLHNGLLLSMSHFSDELKRMNILVEEDRHLPEFWLISAGLALVVAFLSIWLTTRAWRARSDSNTSTDDDLPQVGTPDSVTPSVPS
ncbi:MAG: CPBP family glutamic-type intramembrane protease [Pirellulaceae bacterium]